MKQNHQNYQLPAKANTRLSGLFVFGLIAALSVVTISININELPIVETGEISENVSGEIKDGEYQSIGNYTSPGGPETINVKVVIENGIIKDAAVEPMADRAVSKRYQNEFAENYKSIVVGKKITDLQLDKVAGSSLTPKGFNDAILKIINAPES